MYRIAIIGEKSTVIGFRALGLDAFAVSDSESTKITLHNLMACEGRYAIIYIEETYACGIMDDIEKCKDLIVPTIILIPGSEGPAGLGQSIIDKAIDRAAGADI